MTSAYKYIPALTGLRAVAAYMVFIHHYIPAYKEELNSVVYGILNEMHVGVTIFFVLSGFLIANKYLFVSEANYINYFVKRFARIYPVYILLTLLTLALKYGAYTIPNDILITNLTLIKGYFKEFKFSGIAQTWSLTVEETFYLLVPFSFVLIRRNSNYLILIPAITLAIGVTLVLSIGKLDYHGLFKSFNHLFNYTYFGRVIEFFTGIGLYYFMNRNRIPSISISYTLLGVGIIILSLAGIYLFKNDNVNYGIHTIGGMLINNIILPIFGISVLFIGLIRESTVLSKILATKTFEILGKASYIFYLIHMGVLTDVIMNFLNSETTNIALTFFTINVVSILLYYSIEKPTNQILLKLMLIKK
jgi:peptidoglycan/LPS O-acetylase OafA/YrhL